MGEVAVVAGGFFFDHQKFIQQEHPSARRIQLSRNS
jgi:hypothetical protein